MFCVTEYGDNTGILKNFFQDMGQALCFVQKIRKYSRGQYKSIGRNKWHCKSKNEYLKIEEV